MRSAPREVTPRPPVRRPRLVAFWWGAGLAAVVLAAGVGLASRRAPAFYVARLAEPTDGAAARRFLTKMAAVHDSGRHTGAWDMMLTEAECNAWLSDDLPRNHAGLLPRGIEEPRVRLSRGACEVAAVVTEVAPLPRWLVCRLRPVVAARVDVRLSSAGRMECRLTDVRLGVIPLPPGPLLRGLADRVRRSGLPCETARVDGRSVLVVTLPPGDPGGKAVRVAALAIGEGELLVAGTMAERR